MMKLLFSPSSTPPFSAPTLLGLSLSLLLSSDVVTSSVGAQSLSCSPDQSTLVVRVQTDYYPWHNGWILEKQDDATQDWTVVASRDFEGLERYTVYEDTECLDPDSKYRWTITDDIIDGRGNGISSVEGYSVSINGEVVLSDPATYPDNWWSEQQILFVSPSDPSGPVEYITASPSASPSEFPSVSLNPTESFVPTVTACEGDQSEFTVTLLTDNYHFENYWVLEKLEEESGGWTEVASNPLPEDNTVFEDRACLEPDSTYRWVLTDTFGDGWICYIECAYYELGLNGEIFSSYYETRDYEPPFDEKRVLFVTPSDSSGSAEVVTSGPTTTPSSTPSLSAVPSETPTGSAAPSDSPTVFFCDDESDKPLNIDVKTDDRPYENSWELEEWDDANETWFRIASNGLPYGFDHEFTSYVDNVCLKTGRSYKWTMTDNPNPNYKGNGLGCVAGRGCGKYFVRLDGEIIVSNGKFFSEVVKEIGPIVDCIDEKGLHRVENPRGGRFIEARCKGLRKLIRGSDGAKALEACGATLIDGSGNLWDKCKRSCAAFGAGPCAG